MERSIDIITCGNLCLDLLPQMGNLRLDDLASPGRLFEVGPMRFATGGAASNTGLALHRLGINVRLMSTLGDDQIGQLIITFLQSHDPLLIEYLTIRTGQTSSYTLVLSPKHADRLFLEYAGTKATFSSNDIDYDIVAKARIFHLGYPPLLPALIADDGVDLARLFARVRATGAITSLDMSLPDPSGASGQVNWLKLLKRALPHIDIFIPSLEEILFMLRRDDYDCWGDRIPDNVSQAYLDALIDDLLAMGTSAVVGIKLGEYGVYIRTGDRERLQQLAQLPIKIKEWENRRVWHPAFAVNVAGTTGAGDSAYAGFLAAMLKGLSVDDAARWACAVGACNVEAVDSISGVQSWDVIQYRMDTGWERRPLHLHQS